MHRKSVINITAHEDTEDVSEVYHLLFAFVYSRYAYPMDTCDVLGCPEFAATVVSAPEVEGGHLNICDDHLVEIEAGVRYSVDIAARKLVLIEEPDK